MNLIEVLIGLVLVGALSFSTVNLLRAKKLSHSLNKQLDKECETFSTEIGELYKCIEIESGRSFLIGEELH